MFLPAHPWQKRVSKTGSALRRSYPAVQEAQGGGASRFLKSPHRRTLLSQIARVFDLVSKLGRTACEMPLDGAVPEPQPSPPSGLDFEAALQKIYGTEGSCEGTICGSAWGPDGSTGS